MSAPVSRSTTPPLMPLPPTSTPNPRRCGLAPSGGEAVGSVPVIGSPLPVGWSAGAGMDLGEQRRVGQPGGVRTQARQRRLDVVAVSQADEVTADRQVHRVVGAVVPE